MGPMIHKRDLGPYPAICDVGYWREQIRLQGGTADAGMQIKSAAGGDSWIPATCVSGVMSGAEDAQIR
jgi:hypothetical protein